MRGLASAGLLLAGFFIALGSVPAGAEPLVDRCTAARCEARLTPDQLLREAEALVSAARYDEAKPLLAALASVPGLGLQYHFLSGYVAQQTGDLDGAAKQYRAILTTDPTQTRVRLELARVMLAQGKRQSAERQFKLAEQDDDLPPEIARTIRGARDVLRSRKAWTLNVDAGLLPDSNINNATSADSINVYLGNQTLPLTLDESARPRSGVGRTASIDAGLRLPGWGETMLLFDVNAVANDYDGTTYDDYAFEAAAGSELRVSDSARIRVQAVGAERLYGGQVATRQAGLKGGAELALSNSGRLGVQVDVRRTVAKFNDNYSGWQFGTYATYERAVRKAVVVSVGGFGRRDALHAAAYSSWEGGVLAGVGGELPHGINLGVSGTASRAVYDEPAYFFSPEPRRDWRYSGRVTLGVRAFRVAGLSPTASVSVSRIDSSIDYYAATRVRWRFALARYF